MPKNLFLQLGLTIGLAGLGLLLAWSLLPATPALAQDPTTDWEKADLYGAEVHFPNFTMAANGDLYVCLSGGGYGVYKLAQGAAQWQVLPTTSDGNCSSLAIDNTNGKLYRIGGQPFSRPPGTLKL